MVASPTQNLAQARFRYACLLIRLGDARQPGQGGYESQHGFIHKISPFRILITDLDGFPEKSKQA
jgi:hypothetical protein